MVFSLMKYSAGLKNNCWDVTVVANVLRDFFFFLLELFVSPEFFHNKHILIL